LRLAQGQGRNGSVLAGALRCAATLTLKEYMPSISALLAELPTRSDFAAGISTIRDDLKALRPKPRLRHRASIPPRLAGAKVRVNTQ
jgi:hypothetical protein